MDSARGRRFAIGGLIAVLAGVAIAVGSFLDWVTLTTNGIIVGEGHRVEGGITGLQESYGTVCLAASAVVVLAGLWWMLRGSGRLLPGVLVVVGGAAGLAATIMYLATDVQARYLDWAASEFATRQLPEEELRAALKGVFDANGAEASWGVGLIVALAGAGVAVLVGVVGILRRPADRQAAGLREHRATIQAPSDDGDRSFGVAGGGVPAPPESGP